MIKAGIIGGTGYTGGELVRLLLNHPHAELDFVTSAANVGSKVTDLHPDLLGETDLCFVGKPAASADVLFLALPHKESCAWLDTNKTGGAVIIDLGNDFRTGRTHAGNPFVYGLPELNGASLAGAKHIANPGCFATAIQLAIIPLLQHGEVSEIYVTGITGATGAGKSLSETSHFSWRQNNVSAYKTLRHQHLDEIYHQLGPVASKPFSIQFVPWRGDFARGIFVSSTIKTSLPLEKLFLMYETYYRDQPFTFVSRQEISMKQVVNTNRCLIHIEKEGDFAVVHSAIDNLLKGAAGQAVHNMNLAFGLPETAGLKLKSIVY